MQPPDNFLYHVGMMEGLSPDYLPPAFVALVLSLRVVIVVLLFALPLAALMVPRVFGRVPREPGAVVLPCAMLMAFASFLMAIPFHQFPDEIFVTLTQSRNLAEHGRYSFYPDRNVDGSGDGLFYVAIGGLHAAGIPAPLGALLLGAACGAGSIFLLYRHAFGVTGSHGWAWATALLAAILECFGRLAGSGWSAAMLGLLAIASILLWRSGRWRWTFLVTGILPFCRYDFAFYTVAVGGLLVVACRRREDRPWRSVASSYVASLLGVGAILLFWRLYYGHFIPTCILMKAGSYPRLANMKEALIGYTRELWPVLLVVAAGGWFAPRGVFRDLMPWLVPGGLHLGLVLWGGGDYFPGNRYQIVLTVAVIFAAIECLPGLGAAMRGVVGREAFPAGIGRGAWVAVCGAVGIAGIAAGFRPAAVSETVSGMRLVHTQPDRSIWLSAEGPEAMTVSRLNNHAVTGRFFSRLTQGHPGTRLASLEVASTFYFFDGVPLDVQGFVDRNVATGPRHPNPRRKWDKRLDPMFWERERPEIIWLDTSTEILWYMRFQTGVSRLQSILSWSRHWEWTEPYFASDYLHRHYRPRATLVNCRYLILWLAREDVADEYDLRLSTLGFVLRAHFP